jgi:hypothetical protein
VRPPLPSLDCHNGRSQFGDVDPGGRFQPVADMPSRLKGGNGQRKRTPRETRPAMQLFLNPSHEVFNIQPDAGSGALEWTIVTVTVVLTAVFLALSRREWQRYVLGSS